MVFSPWEVCSGTPETLTKVNTPASQNQMAVAQTIEYNGESNKLYEVPWCELRMQGYQTEASKICVLS